MMLYEYYIRFPDGEIRETEKALTAGRLPDINGQPLPLPPAANKQLAYTVTGKRTLEEKGIVKTVYSLARLNASELSAYL